MDSKTALEKALAFEREFDEARNKRVREFTRLISEVLERPDAKRRLNFIAGLLRDPEALDRAYRIVA
jgi:hypothetical protein